MKDAQATGETFSPQKRTSSTSKMKILSFFQFFGVILALLDPDPDPAAQINADPCGSGSGSETLNLAVWYSVCTTMTNGGAGTVPPLVMEMQTGSTNNPFPRFSLC